MNIIFGLIVFFKLFQSVSFYSFYLFSNALCIVSFCNLSKIWRDVINLPSFPENGEVLTENNMLTVGLSILNCGNGCKFSGWQTVSEIFNLFKPVIATISPALPSCISILFNPR